MQISAFLSVEKGLTESRFSWKVTSSVETGTLTSEKTAAVVEKEAQTTHLIINQVYGGGGKAKHRYPQALLTLQSNRRGYRTERLYHRIPQRKHTETARADRNGRISHFLSDQRSGREDFCRSDPVRSRKQNQEWDLAISNKQYRILLKKGEERLTVFLSMKQQQKELHWQIRKMILIISKKKSDPPYQLYRYG